MFFKKKQKLGAECLYRDNLLTPGTLVVHKTGRYAQLNSGTLYEIVTKTGNPYWVKPEELFEIKNEL